MGEYKWEKYVAVGAAIICFADALWTSGTGMIRDDIFQTGLLFLVLFYVSEFRYRFFRDVRND
jgi:hypothetical protein